MQTYAFMMWVSVAGALREENAQPVTPTFASVSLAAAMWEDRIPKLEWWTVYWEHLLFKLCKLKQPLVLGDKRMSMQALAVEAQEASNDSKKLYSIVRKLAGISSRPLQGIDDEDGNPVVEQYKMTACWRQHIAKLFSASVISDLKSDEHCPNSVPSGCSHLKLPGDFRPSIDDVQHAVAALKDSGVGDDGVAA